MGCQPERDIHGNKKPDPPFGWKDATAILALIAFALWFCYGLASMLTYIAEHQ